MWLMEEVWFAFRLTNRFTYKPKLTFCSPSLAFTEGLYYCVDYLIFQVPSLSVEWSEKHHSKEKNLCDPCICIFFLTLTVTDLMSLLGYIPTVLLGALVWTGFCGHKHSTMDLTFNNLAHFLTFWFVPIIQLLLLKELLMIVWDGKRFILITRCV